MSWLRVRAYNVLQGDAFLITVPDKDAGGTEHERHILIDVGNLNRDTPYKPVIEDVRSVTGHEPVDLYVMTHEHMDHVEGLYYAKEEEGLDLKARYAWLTASAGPGYYKKHPRAKRNVALARKAVEEISRYLEATPENLPESQAMLAMNNFASTDKCVEHLREVATTDRTFYVYRGFNVQGKHPFQEAEIEILAPEEDTSDYYVGVQATALGVSDGAKGGGEPGLVRQTPPAGVDASAFYRLVESRRDSYVDGLLSIDKAKNNTSVVLTVKWRGWLLLFAADAQLKSWQKMYDANVLEAVDFLKVGHHGSHNATPKKGSILSKILPKLPASRRAWGVIPVGPNSFGHPHAEAIDRLKGRCSYDLTENVAEGDFFDYEFPG